MSDVERARRYRARKQAQGFHLINGRWTKARRKQRRPGQEPPHGTLARYVWKQDPCRCRKCKAANTERARRYQHPPRPRSPRRTDYSMVYDKPTRQWRPLTDAEFDERFERLKARWHPAVAAVMAAAEPFGPGCDERLLEDV